MAKKQGNLKKLRMDKVHSGTNYNVIFCINLVKDRRADTKHHLRTWHGKNAKALGSQNRCRSDFRGQRYEDFFIPT